MITFFALRMIMREIPKIFFRLLIYEYYSLLPLEGGIILGMLGKSLMYETFNQHTTFYIPSSPLEIIS